MIALALLAALALVTPAAQEIRHVVVVLLDDVGIDKIGVYGHPTAGPTPVIDALAAGGLLCTRAYANPTCSPTRMAMLTGKYGSRTGIDTGLPTFNPQTNPNGPFAPSLTEPWLPRLLLEDGARSYLVGKWHLNHIDMPDYHQHPIACGFTRWRGHLSNLNGESPYAWTKQIADGNGWSEATTTTFVTTDNALEAWNALNASTGTKSLVWLAFNAPHPPWDVLPPSGTYTPVGGTQTQPKKQQYALQAVDTLLGQLMSFYATQRPVDAAQTLWIIMGDNGTPAAATESPTPAWSHKATVYEGGVHVPLIFWGAGVAEPGRSTDDLVHAVDLWATILDVFGHRTARGPSDSISFLEHLSDPDAKPSRLVVYARHAEPNGFGPKTWREHAAIGPRWKLAERSGTAPSNKLFDLDADPDESSNLYPGSTAEELAAVAELQAVLDDGDETSP